MTTIDQTSGLAEPAEPIEPAALVADSRWDRFDALLFRLSDRLNPILVNEARQALRSKQFVITFMLMLAAGWVWSILGLASIGPAVYYSAEGPSMLFVYHLILSFPLLVVAPYAAFHSLSSERQDRTYELVSITALGARQILSGKLCGIVLQMIIYLSAIFPCLAFTYLLRGLDIFTIVIVVTYTCGFSLALSVGGLLLGAIAPLRQRHIGLSALFAMGLFGALWIDNLWTFALVYEGFGSIDTWQFWLIQLVLLSLFLNYFTIVFLCARSQLLTPSENRSTALRWSLVVAQLTFVGWMAWGQMLAGEEFVLALIFFSALAWYVAGIFLTSERDVLSPRVKRDLPNTTLARWLLTWFTPGPGTGYMFAISNMVAVAILALLPYEAIGELFRESAAAMPGAGVPGGTLAIATAPGPATWDIFCVGVVATGYIVIFLGISTLLVRALRRYMEVRLAAPVVINLVILMVASLTPWVIQMSWFDTRNPQWSLLQITSPVWTLEEMCFERIPGETPALMLAVSTAACIIWLLNLPGLVSDIKQVRMAKPPRVAEEDAGRAAVFAGASGPKDPWDEDDGSRAQ